MNSLMNCKTVFAAAIVATVSLAGAASAGVIETYVQMELEEPFDQGGFGLSIVALPFIQGEVLESRIDVTFTTDATFNAADFSMLIIAPTADGAGGFGNFWFVTGADLGWSGQGTFSALISSNILAGMIHPNPFQALWEIELGPNFGTLQTLTVEHDYIVPAPAAITGLLLGAACSGRRRRR
jgi:hypothetical protein